MFRLIKTPRRERGGLLAGAFLVSTALFVSMMGLLSFSRVSNRQAASLLSRTQLERIAQEKFTRDLLALNKNIDLKAFDINPSTFPAGRAQSSIRSVAGALKDFPSSTYLVVVATLTNPSAPEPRHIRLETLIEIPGLAPAATGPAAAPPAPPAEKTVPLSQYVEDQLSAYLPKDDPMFEPTKRQIMSMLQAQFGSEVETLSVPVQSAQYRDPSLAKTSTENGGNQEGAFYMSPVSPAPPASNVHVRVWKETYY